MNEWGFFLKKKNPVSFTTQGFIYISLTKTSYDQYYVVTGALLQPRCIFFDIFYF